MIRRKKYNFRKGDIIDVEEFHDGRYGAPGEKRQKRVKPTQEQMKAVEEQPTAYDVENMISEVEVKMKAMWYFLDCHSAQCDNESGGDCGYCKKDFYDEIDKIVEQLKNELSNH